MRIATLSRDPSDPPVQQERLPNCEHEVLAFNIDPDRQRGESQIGAYSDIAALFPPGWRPDVFLHWSLEYNAVPIGIESADCLTVATIGDWNLGGQAVQAIGGAFDLLIADLNGCTRLRQLGFENVLHVPLWGYDPHLHRLLPEVERDLDIVMVGNFNHEVQRERSRWLARVAKLSQRYRVCLTSNVYGEDYARLLNRARIVFNRSIRGEINMRVYEALACGALLFNERDNAEIGRLLSDGIHCVLYGDDDIESLLDYYLTHSDERERIAHAGHIQIAPYTYEQIYCQIYAAVHAHLIEEAGGDLTAQGTSRSRARQFARLSEQEREWRYARQRLTLPHRRRLSVLAHRLQPPTETVADTLTEAGIRLCALAEWAVGLTEPAERRRQLQAAVALAHQTLQRWPDQIAIRYNLAQLYLGLNRTVAAMNELQKTLGLLRQPLLDPSLLRGPLFPRRYDAFLVDLEMIYATHRIEEREWLEAMRRLLHRRVLEQCSDLAVQTGHRMEALLFAEEAAALEPERGDSHRRMARLLRTEGRPDEAETCYRRALAEFPFDPESWSELATLLMEQQKMEDCWKFLEEIALIIGGCPPYDFWRPTLRVLASRLLANQKSSPLSPLA
jgi:tetratricopeptide (TPR) repeat protein